MAIYNISKLPIKVMRRQVTSVTCFQSMGYVLMFVELSELMRASKKLLKSHYWGVSVSPEITELHLIDVANYGPKYDKLPVMTASHVQAWEFQP